MGKTEENVDIINESLVPRPRGNGAHAIAPRPLDQVLQPIIEGAGGVVL
jgi:hypothetical protein